MYLVIMLGVLVYSYVRVNVYIDLQTDEYTHCTLLYASQDEMQNRYAKSVRQLGIRTVDINYVKIKTLHGKTYIMPQLVVKNTRISADENNVYVGWRDVGSYVQDHNNKINMGRKGLMGLAIIATYVIVGMLLRDIFRDWAPVYPLILLLCLPFLLVGCPLCDSPNTIITAMSLSGLVLMTAASYLFFWGIWKHSIIKAIIVLCGVVAPTFSAINIAVEPKMCPVCMISGFISYLCGLSALYPVHHVIAKSVSRSLGILMCIFVIVFILANNRSMNTLSYKRSPIVNMIGKSSNEFGISSIAYPYHCIVVSNPMCHACRNAVSDLKKMGIIPIQIPVCSMMKNDSCFQWNRDSISTPMILVFDKNNRVVFQAYGWPIDNYTKANLMNSLRKYHK